MTMGSSASKRNNKQPIRKFRGASRLVSSLKAKKVTEQLQSKHDHNISNQVNLDLRPEGTITETSAAWAALRNGETIDLARLPRLDIAALNQTEPVEENGFTETKCRDVPLHTDISVVNDEYCSLCKQFTFGNVYPCRVCTRVYHISCVLASDWARCADTLAQSERALTNSGWSCPFCDDLAELLTEEELLMLTSIFDQCDVNQDTIVTLDEYVSYKRDLFRSRYDCDLPEAEEEDDVFQFRHMADKNGNRLAITWSTFLKYEAIKVLEKRDKHDLVKLLTAKEIQVARETFRFLDRDGNGVVSHVEATEAYGIWYRNFYNHDSCETRSALDSHIKINAKLLMEADADHNGMKAFRSEPKPTDKKKVMAVATPRETYQQEHRMAKISNLEGRIRKHRVLENAHKTIVSDLYSHGRKDKSSVKLPPICKPAIVLISSQSSQDEMDPDDYTAEEDESNRETYFGRKLSHQDRREMITAKTTNDGKTSTDNHVNIRTNQIKIAEASSASIIPPLLSFGQPKTPERRGSTSDKLVESAIGGSFKRRQSQADLIFETWKADFQTNDTDRASPANLLKKPDQRRRASIETLSSSTRLSPIELMNKSTEAINVLKDVLCPADGRPPSERSSSSESRRPSLYLMSKSETDIWRHCLRIDRHPSLSLNEVNMEELKKCRYLRLPSDYQ